MYEKFPLYSSVFLFVCISNVTKLLYFSDCNVEGSDFNLLLAAYVRLIIMI